MARKETPNRMAEGGRVPSRDGLLVAVAAAGALLATRAAVRARRTYDLRGKTVLITGGSRGLGLVLGRELAREGARLVICARDAAELERARVDLADRGAEVLSVPCDVTDRAQVEELVRAAQERFGRIDVLINNAGIIQVGPMEEMTLEDYEEAMRTHFWAPLYTTLAVLPGMRERREGRIINISSIGGKISIPHLPAYSGSKFALVGFSEGIRAEAAKDGIAVTTVCPGLMRTGSPRNAFFKGRHREEYAWFSVSDSLPVMTTGARRAARQIIDAFTHGDGELVMPALAALQVRLHGLFPELTADVLGLVNRALPKPGGIGVERRQGSESESDVSESWVTELSRRAAVENNEVR